MKAFVTGVVSLALLLAVASAQWGTCDCEVETAMCSRVSFVNAPDRCRRSGGECDKCVCVAGGSMTCVVVPTDTWVITGPYEGSPLFSYPCELQSHFYAACPGTEPTATPSPTPTPTPTPTAKSGWFLTATGFTCDSECTAPTKPCNAAVMTDANNVFAADPNYYEAFMDALFSVTCNAQDCGGLSFCNTVSPMFAFGNRCYYDTTVASQCGVNSGFGERLCCCGDAADCELPVL
eukprot:CAMPEP_0185847352 /NCGR_PEP_ID=MMETSP1354-20130828/2652_1 /TAXON_ID=708628 /ORGANISM="Erythrolobus madagascarensis, Strain CCMP3276" /LENGTH=234 /DNA_ID=CAMNT_0028547631 /DNA_START=214 /DNA_END=918 /DNA_ORIENTATION=+